MKMRRLTMADLVDQEKSRPRLDRSAALIPGTRNRDDLMATPDGERMELVGEVDPEEAAKAVIRGALVVWGACGCGTTDCGQLEWLNPQQVAGRLPVLDSRGIAWLDLWRSASHEVVFGHGDVTWKASPGR